MGDKPTQAPAPALVPDPTVAEYSVAGWCSVFKDLCLRLIRALCCSPEGVASSQGLDPLASRPPRPLLLMEVDHILWVCGSREVEG